MKPSNSDSLVTFWGQFSFLVSIHKLYLCLEELVLTTPEEFVNGTLFPRLGLLSTLNLLTNEVFRRFSWNGKNLKTLVLHFSRLRKYFENEAFRKGPCYDNHNKYPWSTFSKSKMASEWKSAEITSIKTHAVLVTVLVTLSEANKALQIWSRKRNPNVKLIYFRYLCFKLSWFYDLFALELLLRSKTLFSISSGFGVKWVNGTIRLSLYLWLFLEHTCVQWKALL